MSTTHQYETYIRATPEEVFAAITDPAMTRQYFHGTSWDRPPVQGEPYSTSLGSGGPAVDGVVEVLDPPHRLVQTWHTVYDATLAEEPVSRVEWIVEPAGEGLTRLRLVHSDLAQSPLTWANVRHGWVWILDGLKSLLETGRPLPPATAEHPEEVDTEGEWHRAEAAAAFNATWDLIEAERSQEDDEEMLRRAFASAYHWDRAVGRTPVNAMRSLWLLARVHALVGRPEAALSYADRTLASAEADEDRAWAHEARWRALVGLGRSEEAAGARAAALGVPLQTEARTRLEADLS